MWSEIRRPYRLENHSIICYPLVSKFLFKKLHTIILLWGEAPSCWTHIFWICDNRISYKFSIKQSKGIMNEGSRNWFRYIATHSLKLNRTWDRTSLKALGFSWHQICYLFRMRIPQFVKAVWSVQTILFTTLTVE